MKATFYSAVLHTVFFVSSASGQNAISPASESLGGISATLSDIHAYLENPSGMTSTKEFTLGISAGNHYMIPELNTFNFTAIKPVTPGHSIGFHLTRVGSKSYSHQNVQLGYSIRLSPKLSFGAYAGRLNLRLNAEHEQNQSAWTAGLGISSQPLTGLILAMSISNPVRSHWNNTFNTELPVILRFGSCVQLSGRSKLYTQIDKEIDTESDLILGIEYRPVQSLRLRTGVNTKPYRTCFGAGLEWKNNLIDFSCSVHPQLGISSGISIQYKF